MSKKDVRFMVEVPETSHLNSHVQAMLIRECTNFIAAFSGEWLRNVENIEELGFKVQEDGNLVCTKRHLKHESANLDMFTEYENLMEVGQAIMEHNRNFTHLPEEPDSAPFGPIEEYYASTTEEERRREWETTPAPLEELPEPSDEEKARTRKIVDGLAKGKMKLDASFRNGSTCGPDCPTHAHNHYRQIL